MKKRYTRQPKRRSAPKGPKILKPGSDPKLTPVFARIGVPAQKPFKPDPFQTDALDAVLESDCLVTAPTGAGKTYIAETAIKYIHEMNGKAWYASPLKALSNSIYSKFIDTFGRDHVGILTGDRKENPDAPIIVGTTEILRNHLYDAMHMGADLDTDFVVLDEAHFLGDEDRGVVWEEIMIYLPSRIPLLMLSATIGNARVIAEWLISIRGKACRVIEEKKRPVSLHPLFFDPSGTLMPLVVELGKKNNPLIYKKVVSYLKDGQKRFLNRPGKLPPMGEIIRVLRKFNLLPAIFFMKSRADCDNALTLCSPDYLLNNPQKKADLDRRIQSLLDKIPHAGRHRQLYELRNKAVGAHHSGQLPAWKIIIETLMSEGMLEAVFATATVAAGVNFPARTVVLLNSDRFNGTEFLPLTPTEFHQMTGRAGRRGMDNIGFALTLPGKFMDLRHIARLVNAPPSNIESQIKINFSMVLNLLLSHSPEQIKALLEKSFAAFIILKNRKKNSGKGIVTDTHYLWHDFQNHLNFLKKTHYVDHSDTLTFDGEWAARLRIDHPILIAEGFRLDLFSKSDPVLLAAIIAAFVNDREVIDEYPGSVPKKLLKHFLQVKKSLRPFTKDMASNGFMVRSLCIRSAFTLFLWSSGETWETVLSKSDLAEGDLAKLIYRTADNLRHIINLNHVFPDVAKTAAASVECILREPVVSYL